MDKLVQALEIEYGIKAKQVERIQYGLWEESFCIITDSNKWYAKRFWYKTRVEKRYDRMIRGLELSQSLRENGFPAPLLIRTKTGNLLAHVDNESYQVNEWVNGRTYHPGQLPDREAFYMGQLLGKFHRNWAVTTGKPKKNVQSPSESRQRCLELLQAYDGYSEDFAFMAKEVLSEQIALLGSITEETIQHLPALKLIGKCYNSYWVEQLLFHPTGEVAALVDWTDGAGTEGYLGEDLLCCLHLSALDLNGISAFCKGYHSIHPLPADEWKAIAAELCYGYVSNTNFLGGWFDKYNRRMEHWEKIATVWHRRVPARFKEWNEIENVLLSL